ncbi:MAG: division/cell wall cluster transcriptional repressor MraZ [Ruminococcus sp.]|nr:division/cell wall cluster transcriptional repressor MraZ [Ruminococcus sp.]MDY3894966.1 division/cell wall cluster transcriptional repressor MraZ [Candidatus Fimenecus sp.]
MADENVKDKINETSAPQKRTESFGSYKEHTIDAKNRLFIPAKMRNKLGSTFRVFCPIDGSDCLYIYSDEEWSKIAESVINTQNFDMQRLFFGGMVEVEPDKQGRITIPTEFCEFAGLKKNVVVAGVGKRLEIWDADKYYKTMERARNIRQTFDYSQIQF